MAKNATEKSNVVTALVLDFETGGLDCNNCAATQISIHAVRMDTFELMEKINYYIYPYNKKTPKKKKKVLRSKYEIEEESENENLMAYEERAMDISGITMTQLEQSGMNLEDVCKEIIAFIKRNTLNVSQACKPILVGQNILFDIGFLQQIMLYTELYDDFCKVVRCKKDYWGNYQPYYADTIILCQLAMDNDKSIVTWKLESEAERLGVELDDAHDADADVTATEDIMQVLALRMRNEESDGDGGVVLRKKEKTRDYFKI